MQPCANVSKPTSLRPPSSVSLLAEQLKSSSLNDTSALINSLWWSHSHADGLVDHAAGGAITCDLCSCGVDSESHARSGRCCGGLCLCTAEPGLRACDASSTAPSAAVAAVGRPRVPVTRRDNQTGEVFGTSPYAPSSVSSQGQSEPEEEEEDMNSNWRLNQACEEKSTDEFQYYSASAPTTESLYAPYSTSTSRSSFAFNAPCIGTSLAPSFRVSPSNPSRACTDKSALWVGYPCTCHTYLLPAKRACRSLSASASAQQQQQSHSHPHQVHVGYHPSAQPRSHRHSQLIEAHLFEAHFSTLPRPIAIRPAPHTPHQGSADPLCANHSDAANGVRSSTNGVMLRSGKPREYSYGSRLSWHHPVFSSGLGSKAQHPSYGVNFTCTAHSCTAAPRSALAATTNSAALACAVTGPGSQSCALADTCAGRTCKHLAGESNLGSSTGPCAHCMFPNSPQTHSSMCHNSAFTPTHTRFGSPTQPVRTSDCSLSPDVDLSAASSLQIPVPTPSSGFHEASFSCLSEASSLPDCSKMMMGSRQEIPSLHMSTPHSKAIDTPTITRRNPCGASSSCTETTERSQLTESALRCRSQPSEPAPSSSSDCPTDSINSLDHDADSGSKSSTATGTAPAGTIVGLKRRRGPSMDTFDGTICVTGLNALDPSETSWGLSPTATTTSHSPTANDATLVRNGRISAHPDSVSLFSPFDSWSSSYPGVSPFRVPCTLDGTAGHAIAGEVFVFGSGSRLEADTTHEGADVDAVGDSTIKRDSELSLPCRCRCHSCPVCVHGRAPQITTEMTEEGMHAAETRNGIPDGETICARSPIWHPSVLCARAHSGVSCDGTCRTHTFPQLAELSESVEEEKDYETPETMTTEETGSQSDSSWKRSAPSSSLKSPSMHEVTFAPIHLDDPVPAAPMVAPAFSCLPTAQSRTTSYHILRPNPPFPYESSDQTALVCPSDPVEVMMPDSGTGELLLSLSPTDSEDSEEDPDVLSPQLVNREKTKTQPCLPESASSSCPLSQLPNLPCVELDLDLIEND